MYLSVLLTVLAKAAIISEFVLPPLPKALTDPCAQSLDEIYPPRYPRIIRLYDGLPTSLRPHRPSPRLLPGIHQHRPTVMEFSRLLVDNSGSTGSSFDP